MRFGVTVGLNTLADTTGQVTLIETDGLADTAGPETMADTAGPEIMADIVGSEIHADTAGPEAFADTFGLTTFADAVGSISSLVTSSIFPSFVGVFLTFAEAEGANDVFIVADAKVVGLTLGEIGLGKLLAVICFEIAFFFFTLTVQVNFLEPTLALTFTIPTFFTLILTLVAFFSLPLLCPFYLLSI